MRVTVEPYNGTILLIDMSYFIFYRYYAILNWLRRSLRKDETLDIENIMKNNTFVEKYTKKFEETLSLLMKEHGVIKGYNVVLIKDCCRDKIWRHQYTEGYKATRDDKVATFNKDIFTYTYNVLIPVLQNKYGFQMSSHSCLEADDVIAIFTNKLLSSSIGSNIVIITNDNDYIQLLDNENISNGNCNLRIINLQQKDIMLRVGCSPKEYLLVKKIIGDKSDNIPSITKKCGDKTALKLAKDAALLDKLLSSDINAKNQYVLNELLIDFNFIPENFKIEVFSMLNLKSI
jgi:5'-3' exonuclease